jgi:hypothetical protein
VLLVDKASLPMAFVKRGVRAWSVEGDETEKKKPLNYHQRIDLTGKYRTAAGSNSGRRPTAASSGWATSRSCGDRMSSARFGCGCAS